MRNSSVIGRAAATAAVLVAVAAVAVILLSGGSSYQVKAVFTNASQIVSGDLVEVSGNSIGAVNSGAVSPTAAHPGCWVAPKLPGASGQSKIPHTARATYSSR